jgi:hypothetical protein
MPAGHAHHLAHHAREHHERTRPPRWPSEPPCRHTRATMDSGLGELVHGHGFIVD